MSLLILRRRTQKHHRLSKRRLCKYLTFLFLFFLVTHLICYYHPVISILLLDNCKAFEFKKIAVKNKCLNWICSFSVSFILQKYIQSHGKKCMLKLGAKKNKKLLRLDSTHNFLGSDYDQLNSKSLINHLRVCTLDNAFL